MTAMQVHGQKMGSCRPNSSTAELPAVCVGCSSSMMLMVGQLRLCRAVGTRQSRWGCAGLLGLCRAVGVVQRLMQNCAEDVQR